MYGREKESMNSLIVLTEEFPYGKGESFLENEACYWQGFDRVLLIPCSARNRQKRRELPDNIQVVDLDCIDRSSVRKLLDYAGAMFEKPVRQEIGYLLKNKKFCKSTLKNLLSFYTVARAVEKELWQKLGTSLGKDDQNVFYSYWMDFQAYVLCRLKGRAAGKNIFVSRCHGYDVYEERRTRSYIPFRSFTLNGLDRIYCISNNGRAYLSQRYPANASKMETLFLGTRDYGIQKYAQKKESLTIVSCAWVSGLKRLDRMIDALALTSARIRWIHFGAGELLDEIKCYAEQRLGGKETISYEFAGSFTNSELMRQYRDGCYELFVNTSETEGLPVSIMEALSFGIPVVATNVGGVGEIVESGYNGYLMDSSVESPKQLARLLEKLSEMPQEAYLELRRHARQKWEENFNASKNYTAFTDKLLQTEGEKENEEVLRH